MGSLARSGDSDSEKQLLNLSSDAAGSEWSTPIETSVSAANYTEDDACFEREAGDTQELMGTLTRRRSFKVTKGLARMCSSKLRRPATRKGFVGAEQKKKLKLRSIKLASLDSFSLRRKWSSNYDQPSSSSIEADVFPNYLKATRSSDVRKVSSLSSLHMSGSSITGSCDREGKISNNIKPNAARNKSIIAFRRTATLISMRISAKMPGLKAKRPSSKISEISGSSVHRATCSSAIKDSKFPVQVENQQGGDVSGKISATTVCHYSYCSIHGHHHAAATLKGLKSARKRIKSQRSNKLGVLPQSGRKDFGGENSYEAEKAEKELTEEISSRKDMGSNADDGVDRVEEAAEVAIQEKNQKGERANPPVVGKENLHKASDSSSEGQDCLKLSQTGQEAHIQGEFEEDILESSNAEKKKKEQSEESPCSGKVKFVSVGVQTELELEYWGNGLSAADHTPRDLHVEILEPILTVQEGGDVKAPLTVELIQGDSTSNNGQLNSSKTVAIGEKEATSVGSVSPTEELTSAHENMEENLKTPGEPEACPDSTEEMTLLSEEMEHESPVEPTEALSGSTKEPNLACKKGENLESPVDYELNTSKDSFKSSFSRQKFKGLWYLIYQHMVSDVAENGGMESPFDREKEEPVTNANILPELDRDLEVANHYEAAHREELQQSDAIKLLQEAISKILEQSQYQRLKRKSTAKNVNFDKMETGENHSDDRRNFKEADLEEEKTEAQKVPEVEEKMGVNAESGGRLNQLASKRWSNLKKYILMKRFIKAMEKTENFSQKIQRYPSSEVSPNQEKVNLRHQPIGERKSVNEWMLDHALQKVISKLDPAQQRRVALLVEAFETVNPTLRGKTFQFAGASFPSTVNFSAARDNSLVQNKDRTAEENVNNAKLLNGQMPLPSDKCIKVREEFCDTFRDGNGHQKENEKSVANSNKHPSKPIFAGEKPGVGSRPVLEISINNDNIKNKDLTAGPGEGRVQEIRRGEVQSSNLQFGSGNGGTCRKSLDDIDILRMHVPEEYVESTALVVSISSSQVHDELKDRIAASHADDVDEKSMTTEGLIEAMEKDSQALVEKEVISGSSLPEEYLPIVDVRDEPLLERKKYTGLWYLIYKQMASVLATEGEGKPIDPYVHGNKEEEEEEEAENEESDKKSIFVDIDSPDSLESEDDMLTDKRMDIREIKLHKIEAVKLVQRAIDKILLEHENRPPHNQFNIAKGFCQQDSEKKSCSNCEETSLPISTDSTKDSYILSERVKEHKPLLNPEIQIKADNAAPQEGERTTIQDREASKQRPAKNWNNLRKVILIKRFVKALETKVSNFKPQKRWHLPLDPGIEPERVHLKHQGMDERKSSEEYLLDYALQRAVSSLTPARKRKVHLLVEAFETITPLRK